MLNAETPQEGAGAVQDFTPVKSADRALDVLEYLSAHSSAGLVELTRSLGIPKSSLHSILRTLEHRGWIEADASRSEFHLGMNALLTGASYVDQDFIVTRTAEALDSLAAKTGETVHLGRLEGDDVVYLAKRESRHPLRMFSAIGRRLPAHATALGKAMLAEMDDDRVLETLRAPLDELTEHTITSPAAVVASLAEVRARGYAVDDQEAALGLRCFAVTLPFSSPSRDAISFSVPYARLDAAREEEMIALLLATRDELAQRGPSRTS
ncbi:IclR family transcriptional regulator [Demequina sp. NBRC 110056]|uniref:IclR family transcriptional regulator n=1 Tax=Demequina sp. NBRC 110056 TaxID=1570345 RepID=UPI000A072194|nr:IclR family transcriptional regulator [Demequina sp. NBRC 110056]